MVEPLLLTTWAFGRSANAAAWPALAAGGCGLDAVEAVCRHVELDPGVESVGLGARPDASGRVTLDGCVMQSPRRCAGVCALERHVHAVSIARRVMERTPHRLLAGPGADAFADAQGFEARAQGLGDARDPRPARQPPHPPTSPSTLGRPDGAAPGCDPGAEKRPPGAESPARGHDTVCALARDREGVLSGACSSSGLAGKLPGRVGDSPIIGHGLYVHPAHGAAAATGTGELVMGLCGAFAAVEELRRGASPLDALAAVLARIRDEYERELAPGDQVGLIALTPAGEWAVAALRPGFEAALHTGARDDLVAPQIVLIP